MAVTDYKAEAGADCLIRTDDVTERGIIGRIVTGWPADPDIDISFDATQRRITISSTGENDYFYYKGVKYQVSLTSGIFDDVDGLWYAYFLEGSTIQLSQTPWDLYEVCPVAIFFWDSVEQTISSWQSFLRRYIIDGNTFDVLDKMDGFICRSASDPSLFDSLKVSNDSSQKIKYEDGSYYISSIKKTVTGAEPTIYSIVYNDSGSWKVHYGLYPAYYDNDVLYCNNSNTLTPVTPENYTTYHVVATLDDNYPIRLIMGTNNDETLSDARKNSYIYGLDLEGCMHEHLIPLASVVLQRSSDGSSFEIVEILDRRHTTGGSDIYTVETRDDRNWEKVPESRYTATPSSDDKTITMTDTSNMKVGLPIRYKINSTYYYGQIKDVTTDTSIIVRGAPLIDTIDELAIGNGERVVSMMLNVQGNWNPVTENSIIHVIMNAQLIWTQQAAYCVGYVAYTKTDDSSENSQVAVLLNGSQSVTTPEGVTASSTFPGTWNNDVDINTSNYKIEYAEAVDLSVVNPSGATGDAEHLSVNAIFVLE